MFFRKWIWLEIELAWLNKWVRGFFWGARTTSLCSKTSNTYKRDQTEMSKTVKRDIIQIANIHQIQMDLRPHFGGAIDISSLLQTE